VLPRATLQLPTPSGVDARRALLARSARALGVATADDLRDYYRIPAADARLPIEQLVEEGTIIPVRVRGWQQQAYLHKDARADRKVEGSVLLSPFDPLIGTAQYYRKRGERRFVDRAGEIRSVTRVLVLDTEQCTRQPQDSGGCWSGSSIRESRIVEARFP
jgi:uncharacterized protein YcaQ